MAPKYRLTYFNIRGLAELPRFILSYMGENFEDVRMEREEWPTIKPNTPFGKVPMLEVDGKAICQSIAISRYLGKKAGLAGKDDWENLQIDMIADTITDVRLAVAGFLWEANEDVKKTKKETFINETLPFYFKKLNDIAKENGGYLANGKLSWADFLFTTVCDLVSYACDVPDVTDGYPALQNLRKEVLNIPQIKKWVEKRPNTQF